MVGMLRIGARTVAIEQFIPPRRKKSHGLIRNTGKKLKLGNLIPH